MLALCIPGAEGLEEKRDPGKLCPRKRSGLRDVPCHRGCNRVTSGEEVLRYRVVAGQSTCVYVNSMGRLALPALRLRLWDKDRRRRRRSETTADRPCRAKTSRCWGVGRLSQVAQW